MMKMTSVRHGKTSMVAKEKSWGLNAESPAICALVSFSQNSKYHSRKKIRSKEGLSEAAVRGSHTYL